MAGVPSGRVALMVRVPAQQRHRDLLLPARRSWTVGRLKEELRRRHPGAPPEDAQRLIYYGKLLQDNLTLQEVLSEHEMVHLLHLVCSSKNLTEKQEEEAKDAEAERRPATLNQEPPVLPLDHAWSEGENSHHQPLEAETTGERPPPAQYPFQNVGLGYTSYTMYRLLQFWSHQVYARQYYMQYMAANAASGDSSSRRRTQEIPVTPVAPPAPLSGPFPVENQPAGNQNAPPPVNPGANQNLRMNAQGGALMEEDEDGGHRDWLDWLYSATLFYVFVNLVYFYSSLSRFLMVMLGTLLMYLHRVGWFPFTARAAGPPQPRVPAQAAVDQDPNNNLQEDNVGDQGEVEGSGSAPENQPVTPSFVSTACLFFKTFFASLLPEVVPPVVAD
ncbi:hypothetical protein JRQ81_006488 [Phrynocephalus forsythii]|uniref:Ubiquitin-like domain-containing protein n=1 Tax=Phrynocephalus forsythii TaxID=171643 RepID=A0A9Q0XFA9_9SAUR|nr:hypothetical protein JRQ81_006488 [Phrynocephalus forsythii]